MRDSLEQTASILSSHDGESLFGAPEAVLKGLLEAETAASLVAGPRLGAFAALLRLGADEAVAELLRRHDIRLAGTPTTARAITLAHLAARGGGAAVALVPNGALAVSTPAVARAAGEVLPRGGALVLVLEDAPVGSPEIGPIGLARTLGLGLIAPSDVGELRDAVETALRLSRAGHCPIGIMVHAALLRSAKTIEARPNRVIESVDAMLARRRRGRRPRFTETADVLRLVRRLEINRARGLPSPGERTAVGFLTVGPATEALGHLVHVLRLVGRVPVVQLGCVNPIDDVFVGRLLARCERVVVLEPRPGAVEAGVLEVAEAMRRRGDRPATVWGRALPGEGAEPGPTLGVEQALHPSSLARGIVPLLHMIRPTGRVDAQFVPDPAVIEVEPPPRGTAVGTVAATVIVRRVAAEVDQWLRERRDDEESPDVEPTVLEIDGARPSEGAHRVVTLETWTPERFVREGVAAIRQSALDDAPSIFIVSDVGQEDGPDLVRFAGGVIPAERAGRVRVETANFAEPARFSEILRAAALADGMTIVIVRDGPPPVCDTAALERSLADIDRLGFEPRQRVTWPVERACALRPPVEDDAVERRSQRDNPRLHSEARVDRLPRRRGSVIRFRARPLLEQVEVVRTRPPMRRWRRDPTAKLPLPDIIHREASRWRAHLAGIVSPGPGLATQVLARAGRRMGYAVSYRYDATPIGAGRRAWAQVLFTRPRAGEVAPPIATGIPFGGADLLLGLDAAETLRAIASDPALRVAVADRTYTVANLGFFRDEVESELARGLRGALRVCLRDATRAQPRVMDDFAGVCRLWFHTDRVVNIAILGAAFQSGLVPVTVDAIEAAVKEAEAGGYGRVMQAFQFGRRLAVDARLFGHPQDDAEEDVEHVARRMVHQIAREWRGGARSERFARLVHRVLTDMPGLSETDPGRQARRDIVLACYRCLQWGGVECAERYVSRITGLYRADRGDTGRAITRNAVLPLASAMLIQDIFYVAAMATSGEQRRRTRRILNVRRARGDELQRRFLTRFELIGLRRRVRFDLRTSDWPARAAAAMRFLVPQAVRGSRRERDLRTYIVDLVERATRECRGNYEHFQTAMARLHQEAIEQRMRGMAISEMRLFAEPGSEAEGGDAVAGEVEG